LTAGWQPSIIARNSQPDIAMDQFRTRREPGWGLRPHWCVPGHLQFEANQSAPRSAAASHRSSIDRTLFTAKVCV